MWINDISDLMSFSDHTEKYMSYLCVVLVYENVIWVAYNQCISTNYFEVHAQLTVQRDNYQCSLLCNVNIRCKHIVGPVGTFIKNKLFMNKKCECLFNTTCIWRCVCCLDSLIEPDFCMNFFPLYSELLHCRLKLI